MSIYSQTIAAGILSGLFTTSALAQATTAQDLENLQAIESCMIEAIDAVDVPGAQRYYDPEDHGHKKYLEDGNVFAGISAFVNPYGEDEGVITDTVHFMTKYYQETGDENFIDMFRTVSMTFTSDETIHQDDTAAMSYNAKHMLSDFDNLPEYSDEETAARNWAHDAASLAALHFTICMNLEPYEPSVFGGSRPVQPPEFPHFEAE